MSTRTGNTFEYQGYRDILTIDLSDLGLERHYIYGEDVFTPIREDSHSQHIDDKVLNINDLIQKIGKREVDFVEIEGNHNCYFCKKPIGEKRCLAIDIVDSAGGRLTQMSLPYHESCIKPYLPNNQNSKRIVI